MKGEARYGFVGIIVPHESARGAAVQKILAEFAYLIEGRMGLPHLDDDRISIITLVVRASPEELSALTGKLGRLEGVSVKSALAQGASHVKMKEGDVHEAI